MTRNINESMSITYSLRDEAIEGIQNPTEEELFWLNEFLIDLLYHVNRKIRHTLMKDKNRV